MSPNTPAEQLVCHSDRGEPGLAVKGCSLVGRALLICTKTNQILSKTVTGTELCVGCSPGRGAEPYRNPRTAWVERDHNDHPVPTPCYVQGHQPAAQAAQSHIQPGLECLQGWGIHSLLGQPVQCVTTPWVKNFLLISNLNLPYLSSEPFSLVLSLSSLVNSRFPSCLCTPFSTGRPP